MAWVTQEMDMALMVGMVRLGTIKVIFMISVMDTLLYFMDFGMLAWF
jgi:hypothetical protein